MYQFLEKIWEQCKEIHYYLLKLVFKDHLKYQFYILDFYNEAED